LQAPQIPIDVQNQSPAVFREVIEGDLIPHPLVGWPAVAQGVAVVGSERFFTHAEVGVLSGPLQVKEPREHRGVAFGAHAAVVVESNIAGDAVR
jgi:hypothetical protein